MKNFDEARAARKNSDRAFQIGGETFVMRSGVRPESLIAYETMTGDMAAGDALTVIDDLVLTLIEPHDNATERYRNIRANEDEPVTLADLQELVKWMVESQAARPTLPPSPSPGGRGNTGTTLTAVSSSPDMPQASTA